MSDALTLFREPVLNHPRMIIGFTGWMDGGDVSTETIEYLREKLDAESFAAVEPDSFYIYNFPGSMDVSALFRPHVTIDDGQVTSLDEPENIFYCSEAENLILFSGHEPNLRWDAFADSIFSIVSQYQVSLICFAGSVAGTVPHTRDPRFHFSVSDAGLIEELERHGMDRANYEGPGSFVTWLTMEASRRGVPLASIVAEIPAYVQGRNPRAIEAMIRKLAAILPLNIIIDDLKLLSLEFEKRLNEIVQEKPDLKELIISIEKEYDRESLDPQREDLREWFEKQNIRLD